MTPMQSDSLSTRDQILRLLRTRGPQTASHLAQALGLTLMGALRQLHALTAEGLVKRGAQRQPKGRPIFLYELTGAGFDRFPRNYHALANQLLDVVASTGGARKVDSLFAGRMDQLYAKFAPRMAGKDLAGRVAELAKIQDETGYMATWEKVKGGYLLREQNCAIYRVACRFQQACQYEIELFRRLLDANITRLDHQVKGDLQCTYFVRERKVTAHIAPKRASSSNRKM
jgi:predicted ArsR family transcriptional regulator